LGDGKSTSIVYAEKIGAKLGRATKATGTFLSSPTGKKVAVSAGAVLVASYLGPDAATVFTQYGMEAVATKAAAVAVSQGPYLTAAESVGTLPAESADTDANAPVGPVADEGRDTAVMTEVSHPAIDSGAGLNSCPEVSGLIVPNEHGITPEHQTVHDQVLNAQMQLAQLNLSNSANNRNNQSVVGGNASGYI
jgi:hypothetical protein